MSQSTRRVPGLRHGMGAELILILQTSRVREVRCESKRLIRSNEITDGHPDGGPRRTVPAGIVAFTCRGRPWRYVGGTRHDHAPASAPISCRQAAKAFACARRWLAAFPGGTGSPVRRWTPASGSPIASSRRRSGGSDGAGGPASGQWKDQKTGTRKVATTKNHSSSGNPSFQ